MYSSFLSLGDEEDIQKYPSTMVLLFQETVTCASQWLRSLKSAFFQDCYCFPRRPDHTASIVALSRSSECRIKNGVQIERATKSSFPVHDHYQKGTASFFKLVVYF